MSALPRPASEPVLPTGTDPYRPVDARAVPQSVDRSPDCSVARGPAPGMLPIPAPRVPVETASGSGRGAMTDPGSRGRARPAPAPTSAVAGLRRNRIWAVVGHTGTVVMLAAALTICASIAARVDGPSRPADTQRPPSSDGAGSPGTGGYLQPVPLTRP